MVRLFIVEALEEGGYPVLEAPDGPSAIEQIDHADQLRGLVTDIRLGESVDGWAVARHARERFPSLPVVYVTGDSMTEWRVHGVPRSHILQKPFVVAELVTALADLLLANQAIPPH